jgi:CheY-like chemotaxis protein
MDHSPECEQPPPGPQGSVLVVDDNRDVCVVLARMLEQGGYSVQYALSGQQALEMVTNKHPDVIIIDLFMPEHDDFRSVFALRLAAPEVPVVAMSAVFDKRYLDVVRMLGACAILEKPFRVETVLQCVAKALEPRATDSADAAGSSVAPES